MQLIVERAFHSKAINVKRAEDVLKVFVCHENNFNCRMRRCQTCKRKKIQFNHKINPINTNIGVRQWETKQEQRNIKGAQKNVHRKCK